MPLGPTLAALGLLAAVGDRQETPAPARYVRIELPGPQRILSLAEVQVFSGTKNKYLSSHKACGIRATN